jgi:hypothetical protein
MMMNNECRFKINAMSTIWELIDKEIVLINLVDGHYYHLFDISMTIWLMMDAGFNYGKIINTLSAEYNQSDADIALDLNKFIEDLIAENLVATDEEQPHLPANINTIVWTDHKPSQYSIPLLKKYTDMENLLIDPIHEVDQHGWPNRYPTAQE